ncbi:MAG: cysteine synthase family protein [Chloroflexi bacterium]|nr:cysteine synthase family protein [Chloroflexota bacterium]
MKFKDILDAVGHTPLVEVARLSPKPQVHIYTKLEGNNPSGSVKDRIAKYMILKAEEEGKLTPDRTILEPTSGNTGISLAMIGRRRGHKVKVVMPENVSSERRELLELYGAEIVYSDGSQGTNGAIEVAQKMAAEDHRYFMPYQYGNEANPRAHYETTAQEIIDDLPDVDVFVAGLGTGGTLMGVGRRLKEHNSKVKVIATVPHPGDLIFGLRSLEEGFIPPILDLALLDGRLLIDSCDSFMGTRDLAEKEGIFAGVSSGAAIRCAQRVAQRMDKGNVVVLLADGGWKYLSTHLWTRPCEGLDQAVQGKIWW